MLPHVTARGVIGAGVAVAVPVSGGLLAATPAMAAKGVAPADKGTAKTPSATQARQAVLHFGSRGAAVKVVQAKVGVRADGIFGPLTLAAVKSFQKSHGLDQDGIVGPATWAKLGSSATASTTGTTGSTGKTGSTGSASCASATVLVPGAKGNLVKVLQTRLGLVVDGWYGPVTRAKVVAFQKSQHLITDGVVGPATWGKLGCQGSTGPVTTPGKTTPGKTTPTPSPAKSAPASSSSASTSVDAATIIAYAKQFVGVPYVWGGSSPSGFDCSGLTSYVFNHYGYSLPRTAAQQQARLTPTTNPQPGDLVFFGYPAYHVGIYLGDGMILDAPHPGANVSVRKLWGTPTSYARVLR